MTSNSIELIELAGKLTADDKALLLGTADGWGSWMFTSGEYMVSLGLGTKCGGSISFDTPLAKDMIAYLRATQSVSEDDTHD